MGIRFRCHQCGHELHVKDFQGGKRGKCPECEIRFRIPQVDAEFSLPLADGQSSGTQSGTSSGVDGTLRSDDVTTESLLAIQPRTDSASQAKKVGGKKLGNKEALLEAKSAVVHAPEQAIETGNIGSAVTSDPKIGVAPGAQQSVGQTSADSMQLPETLPPPRAVTPNIIAEAPGATWFVRPPSGGQFGPAPSEVFVEWLNENRVTRDSLVWREGWPQWLVAGDVLSDYFCPDVALAPLTQPNASESPAVAAGLPPSHSLVSHPPAFAAQSAPTSGKMAESIGERTRLARKAKRRRQYVTVISILAVLAVALVATLIVVLMNG